MDDLALGDQAEEGTPGTGENVCPVCEGIGLFDDRPCPHRERTGVVIEGIGDG